MLQGLLAGPGAIYLFTRSVVLLGAGRAAVFPTLVPPCVLLIGWIALGIVPSVLQLVGLAIVLIGFRLTQRDLKRGTAAANLGVAVRIAYFPHTFAQHLVLEAAWKRTACKTPWTRWSPRCG